MAQDPGLLADVQRRIDAGTGPATAVDQAVEGFCKILEASGPYLAERVTDLRDVRDRIVAKVLGVPEPGMPPLSKPTIIVATDLAPADTATLDLDHVVGIVTELGGPTSHTAIIAAQLEPALSGPGRGRACSWPTTPPSRSTPRPARSSLDPDDEPARGDRRPGEGPRRAEDRDRRGGQDQGRVGVQLLANIGAVEDAERAAKEDVEGVGLFRTEVLFLDSATAPTVADQVKAYTKVFRRSVTARSSSARWMPAPTSRWPSRPARRRRTRHSASAATGWTGASRSCWTTSSRPSRRPPRPPARRCG